MKCCLEGIPMRSPGGKFGIGSCHVACEKSTWKEMEEHVCHQISCLAAMVGQSVPLPLSPFSHLGMKILYYLLAPSYRKDVPKAKGREQNPLSLTEPTHETDICYLLPSQHKNPHHGRLSLGPSLGLRKQEIWQKETNARVRVELSWNQQLSLTSAASLVAPGRISSHRDLLPRHLLPPGAGTVLWNRIRSGHMNKH